MTGTTKLNALPGITQLQQALALTISLEQGPAAELVLALSPKEDADRVPAPKAADVALRVKAVAAAGEAETGLAVIKCAAVGAKMASAREAASASFSTHLDHAASLEANLEVERIKEGTPDLMIDADPALVAGDHKAGTEDGPLPRLHLRSRMMEAGGQDTILHILEKDPANSLPKVDATLVLNASGLTMPHRLPQLKVAKAVAEATVVDVLVAETGVIQTAKATESPREANADRVAADLGSKTTNVRTERNHVPGRIPNLNRDRRAKADARDPTAKRKLRKEGVGEGRKEGLTRLSSICTD